MVSDTPILKNAIPGTTIITGTVAAARQLLANHDANRRAEGRPVWESPDIVPRDAWVRRAWAERAWNDPAATPVLLTRWQELALWEEAIQTTERDILLNAHATARAAAEAWQLLHAWEAPLEATLETALDAPLYTGAFERTEDAAAFAMWMKRVQRRLADRGWITAAELPGTLYKSLAFGAGELDVAPMALFGFDEIAPADRRLFNALGASLREAAVHASQPRRAICHDAADELTRAATWARQKLADRSDLRIGIAMPSMVSLSGVAERIFDDILHPAFGFDRGPRAFEIASGSPLAASPMISAALLVLRLMDGLAREEAALLWRTPFIAIDLEEGARLDAELRRAKVDPVNLRTSFVARRFAELAAFAAKSRNRARPSQWSETFTRALGLAGWPGSRALTQVEAQTAEAWKDLLSEFARLDSVIDSLSHGHAISHLQRMAEATRLPRERGDAPVQILDIGETGGTNFDALWIAGLDAGAWPRRVQPNPFLPLGVQRAANMPGSSADREFAYAQRVTARLFASAPEVVCSYPAHAAAADKNEQQQASPFIRELPLMSDLMADVRPYDGTAVSRVFMQAPELEPRPADAHLALPPGTGTRGGSRVLADQSACPFRAFAVHRLGARELDDPDVGLSALDRGSLAHRVLEFLWAELRSSERLAGSSPDELGALVHTCTGEALEKYFAKHDPSAALTAFRALEQARLERLICKWLEIEKRRRPFAVAYNEHKRTVEVAGLKLDLRVDRIDRYADGTYAIIDYKTSKILSADMWQGERPEQPQLPLYAVTSDVPVSEVAFAQITTASQEWIHKEGAELDEMRPEWNRVVHRLASDFLNGRAEVDPREKPSPCDLCALHALCRIHEMRWQPRTERGDAAVLAEEDAREDAGEEAR